MRQEPRFIVAQSSARSQLQPIGLLALALVICLAANLAITIDAAGQEQQRLEPLARQLLRERIRRQAAGHARNNGAQAGGSGPAGGNKQLLAVPQLAGQIVSNQQVEQQDSASLDNEEQTLKRELPVSIAHFIVISFTALSSISDTALVQTALVLD